MCVTEDGKLDRPVVTYSPHTALWQLQYADQLPQTIGVAVYKPHARMDIEGALEEKEGMSYNEALLCCSVPCE